MALIGAAKELVESVAKVVIAARGNPVPGNLDFGQCLTAAHRALERQAGEGLARDAPLRDIAQGYKQIAMALAPLRNSHGSGHGRHLEPYVQEELATSAEAAALWCKWALRRLGPHLIGAPHQILEDPNGGLFHRGSLIERLKAAPIEMLEPEMQRSIGLAVAYRARGGTFVVRDDGVIAPAGSDDYTTWPPAYREGVILGTFIRPTGSVDIDPASLPSAARMLAEHPEADRILDVLVQDIDASPWHPDQLTSERMASTLKDMATQAPLFRKYRMEDKWQALRNKVAAMAAVVEPGLPESDP